MEDKKTRTTKKIDLLTSVESIVYLAKESKLNKEFYRKADMVNCDLHTVTLTVCFYNVLEFYRCLSHFALLHFLKR